VASAIRQHVQRVGHPSVRHDRRVDNGVERPPRQRREPVRIVPVDTRQRCARWNGTGQSTRRTDHLVSTRHGLDRLTNKVPPNTSIRMPEVWRVSPVPGERCGWH
jgi:hypothetical protein